MYAVVGCNECSALWVVEGRPDTTACPRCRKRHRFKKLKQFFTHEEADMAKEIRSRMLRQRAGFDDMELDSFSGLEEDAMNAGMSDAEYLEASGLDAAEIDAAGERADGTTASRSRKEVVLDALRDLERPTEEDVVEYADDAGVDADYARRALEKLTRRGEVSESRGVYRLL
ncbi:DUF5817 domain-containing protein [Natronomonas sp. EA1]|uniref:DUF5817 domain-containing protein n=1 Tax=Natronomonas sp. EA1 TaxID=3421655 RepID=UPI003EB6B4E9